MTDLDRTDWPQASAIARKQLGRSNKNITNERSDQLIQAAIMIWMAVDSVKSLYLSLKGVFAPIFYSSLHQMPYSKVFSVVNVNSILSLNQMKTTSISNSFEQHLG